jgi:hypothetical protein
MTKIKEYEKYFDNVENSAEGQSQMTMKIAI